MPKRQTRMMLFMVGSLVSFVVPLAYVVTPEGSRPLQALSQPGGLILFLVAFFIVHGILYGLSIEGRPRLRNILSLMASVTMALVSLILLLRGFRLAGTDGLIVTRLAWAPFLALSMTALFVNDWFSSMSEMRMDTRHAPKIRPIEVFLPDDSVTREVTEDQVTDASYDEILDHETDPKDNAVIVTGIRMSVEDLVIPAMIGGKPVKSVAPGAFEGNLALSRVTIHKGLSMIGDNAFKGCRNITSLKLPVSVKEIGAEAFSGLARLESVRLPEGLKSVSYGLFSGCRELRSVIVPSTVSHIGLLAFKGCRSLEDIVVTYNGQKHAIRFEYGHLSPFAKARRDVIIAIPKPLTDLYMKHMEWRSVASNVRAYDKVVVQDDQTS
jgi:hypothetical protein